MADDRELQNGDVARDGLPATLRRSPRRAQRTWLQARDSARRTYGGGPEEQGERVDELRRDAPRGRGRRLTREHVRAVLREPVRRLLGGQAMPRDVGVEALHASDLTTARRGRHRESAAAPPARPWRPPPLRDPGAGR